ncbi:MAG: hypothetical protein SFX72_01635 [Isosphaeraceae bacterium]|nr:hypothetical protein [Isosphaeraceae bacterium]
MQRSYRRAVFSLVAAAIPLVGGMIAGCGGVDDSAFTKTPGTVAPDAPKTPAEYDEKFPVPNAGDAKAKASNITNP